MNTIAAVEIADSLQQGLDSFFGFLPNLLAFLVILVIGYIIARIVKGIVAKLLDKAGLDKALHSGPERPVRREGQSRSQSRQAGRHGRLLADLPGFVLSAAIGALKIPARD